MAFPMDAYLAVFDEAQAIVKDRASKGRDEFPFELKYIHGHGDKVQEVWERARRIRGAYLNGNAATMREDLVDLLNEAAMAIVLLDESVTKQAPVSQ